MYKVNENCIGCGACIAICPEVFQFNEEGFAKTIYDDVLDEYKETAKEAAKGCPVNAIVEEKNY